MTATTTLRNRTKFIQVLNLPHGDVPEHATMGVVGTQSHDTTAVAGPQDGGAPLAGTRSLIAHRKPISGSVTLLARGDAGRGDYAEDLPRSVLQAPDVIEALRRGDVERLDAQEAPPPAAAAVDQAPKLSKTAGKAGMKDGQ